MTREQFTAIKALIDAKEYAQARALLAKINHPQARKWEARLNEIAPVKRRNDLWILVIVALVVIGIVAAGVWWQGLNQGVAEIYQTIEARPPGQ